MSDLTPMMKQYRRIKSQQSDAVLFFRLGDFYEMFDRDAKEVSHLLNLTLTKRNGTPMCGIPYHAANSYIPRLLRAGKKIAICEQTSIPGKGKGIVDREVVEIITPGTVTEEDFLDQHKNNYFVSIGAMKNGLSLCYIDLSTGECAVRTLPSRPNDELLTEELYRLDPSEILLQESLIEERPGLTRFLDGRPGIVINRYPDWMFDAGNSYEYLKRFFGMQNLKGFGFEENDPVLTGTGALFEYIEENSRQVMHHIHRIVRIDDRHFVGLDEATQKNLEIVASMNNQGSTYSLLEVVDHTRTAMGARELRKRLLHPLRSIDQLNVRLDYVDLFYKDQMLLTSLRTHLASIRDIERLTSRIALDKAHAKDLLAVKHSLVHSRELEASLPPQAVLSKLAEDPDRNDYDGGKLQELITLLEEAIHEDPSIYLNEGRLIRSGYSVELDTLRDMKKNSRQVLNEYLDEEKRESGIQNLKIKYNKIIGHFLEVTKSHIDKVPDHFIRRQSLVGSERYTTDRLNQLEEQLNNASEQIIELEKKLFIEIRNRVKEYLDMLLALSKGLSALDCFQSLAYAATVHGWTRPEINDGNSISILRGRHPVVELHSSPGSFVPNSIEIDTDLRSFALITGPNMSGKSTFLRQIALIVLLTQVGSFVPAEEASIGLVDRIFCRVGASDNLARGESTFLVEMNETSFILHTSTERSLIIMDEVGRGTSTHDGLSIAWAVSEYLLSKGCKTLFATHYHELTVMEDPAIQRLFLDVREEGGEIIFLKRVLEGSAARSYGLHVARLAGLPQTVLERAQEILSTLEAVEHSIPRGGGVPVTDGAPGEPEQKHDSVTGELPEKQPTAENSQIHGQSHEPPGQASLFDREEFIQRELSMLDVNTITPLQALEMLARWKKELEAD